MYLDTLSASNKAIKLYEKYGFTVTERYNDNKNADLFMVLNIELWRYAEKVNWRITL